MRNLEKEQRLGRNGIENLCIKPTFNYCTGEEQFTFFKLPKCLIDDACFLGLLQSADSTRRFCGAKRTRCGASGLN